MPKNVPSAIRNVKKSNPLNRILMIKYLVKQINPSTVFRPHNYLNSYLAFIGYVPVEASLFTLFDCQLDEQITRKYWIVGKHFNL